MYDATLDVQYQINTRWRPTQNVRSIPQKANHEIVSLIQNKNSTCHSLILILRYVLLNCPKRPSHHQSYMAPSPYSTYVTTNPSSTNTTTLHRSCTTNSTFTPVKGAIHIAPSTHHHPTIEPPPHHHRPRLTSNLIVPASFCVAVASTAVHHLHCCRRRTPFSI